MNSQAKETKEYPYEDGDVIVLGPQIYAVRDGAVINWQGIYYVPMEDPNAPAPDPSNWSCTIGEVPRSGLPMASDANLRQSVERMYKAMTGRKPDYIFSGWGIPLPERYRACVENRMPRGPFSNEA